MKKKIFAVILAMTLMLAYVTPFSAIAELSRSNEAEFLSSVGALPEGYADDELITRGEFAYIVAHIFSKDMVNSALNENSFYDVGSDYLYSKEISALKNLQIVSGDAYGNFYPDANITVSQAAAMLVNALSLKQYAITQGGYPTGYIYTAKLIGALKGVNIDGVNLISSQAVLMIYNSLFSNPVKIDSIKEDGLSFTLDYSRNVMLSALDIEIIDAVIVSDGFTEISGGVICEEGRVIAKEYSTGDVYNLKVIDNSIYNYLGHRLKLYVKYNKATSVYELIHHEGLSIGSVTTVQSYDIIDAADGYIEYEIDDLKTKKINFSKSGTTVIINGVKKPDYTKADLIPSFGIVTAIDHDGDNAAEVISIMNFSYNVIADRIVENEGIVSCRLNPINSVNLSDDSTTAYRVIKDGEIVKISDIKPFDVVSVAVSSRAVDGKYLYYMYVSGETVTGGIDSYSKGEGKVFIEDAEYEISENYLKVSSRIFEQIKFGVEITARLDITGRIAYIDNFGSRQSDYYYLITLYKENGLESDVKLKMYGQGATFTDAVVSPKVTVDGKKLDGKLINGSAASGYQELQQLLCVRPDGTVDIPTAQMAAAYNKSNTTINPRPAIVKFNGKNEVISIDTDALNSGQLSEDINDPEALTAGKRYFKMNRFNNTNLTIDNTFFLTGDTIIYKVPDIDRYEMPATAKMTFVNTFEQELSNLHNYRTLDLDYNSIRDEYLDIQPYDVDPDTGVANLVIIRGEQSPRGNFASPMAYFSRVTDYYDPELERTIPRIYYFYNGKEYSMLVDEEKAHPYFMALINGGNVPSVVSGTGTNETVEYRYIEPLEEGDIIGVEGVEGYLTCLWRDIDISDINNTPCTSGRPTSSIYVDLYASAMPYDTPLSNTNIVQTENTYTRRMGIPVSIAGNRILLKIPANVNNTSVSASVGEYLTNPSQPYLPVYLTIGSSQLIQVIEETVCRHSTGGKCEFKYKLGSVDDIKYENYVNGDKYKASRILYINSYGNDSQITVFNLKEEHYR